LDYFESVIGTATEQNVHGLLHSLLTAQTLNSGASIGPVTIGTGKLVLALIAGSDAVGTIRVTGTSVDRETGVETASDTDDLTIGGLTTDASDTDANTNTRHAFTDAYITSKWFTGSVTISTTDVNLSDVDVYQCSFEQLNDTPQYVLDTLDLNAVPNNSSAEADIYLYSLTVVGSKCAITREASINLTSITASVPYRARRGNIGKALKGATDGFWVDMFLTGVNQWNDVGLKVWAKAIGAGQDLTRVVYDSDALGDVVGPSASTDNALARWDGATGKLLQNSTVLLSDSGRFTNVDRITWIGSGYIDENGGDLLISSQTDDMLIQVNDFTHSDVTITNPLGGTIGVSIGTVATAGSFLAVDTIKARETTNGPITLQPTGTGAILCSDARIQQAIIQDTHFLYIETPTASERMELRLITAPNFQVEAMYAVIDAGNATIDLGKIDWDGTFVVAPTSILDAALTITSPATSASKTSGFTNIDGSTTPQILVMTTTVMSAATKLRIGIKFRMERE
jgi:hypothetical protein